MEGSKRFEDAALRGITRHHVWKSRTSDLTVVNLRDPGELLGTPEAVPEVAPAVVAVAATPASLAATPAAAASTPAAAVTAEVKRPAVAPTPPPSAPPPRPSTGKQESVSALLSKLRLGSPATEVAGPPKAPLPFAAPPAVVAASPVPPPQPPVPAAAAATSPFVVGPPSTATTATPAAFAMSAPLRSAVSLAPSPPVRVAETHQPAFPDLRESSSSAAAGRFEFISGTNIPGQGVVKKPEPANESSSMALFHDPLWGACTLMDAFSTPPPKKTPQPPQRTSLADFYATAAPATNTANTAGGSATTAASLNAFHTATPPATMHTPIASPPVPTMAGGTAMPATMAPQPLPMMGEMVNAPAPQLATSYPMYTMPLQYVAQPQFPGGVVYNSAAFFPYGTTAMMLPQQMGQPMSQPMNQQMAQQLAQQMSQPMQQQFPQGFPMATAAMMRPGTNVKAMPFVPGSTM